MSVKKISTLSSSLTVQRLREMLSYDPETGGFTWLKANGKTRARVGEIAGNQRNGYWMVGIDKSQYRAHRLAWFYSYGVWPNVIDHKDGNPLNNRLENLRDVTHAANRQNERKLRTNNSHGYRGIVRHQGGWRARIKVDGKSICLGVFDDPKQAHQVYMNAKKLHHPFQTIAT